MTLTTTSVLINASDGIATVPLPSVFRFSVPAFSRLSASLSDIPEGSGNAPRRILRMSSFMSWLEPSLLLHLVPSGLIWSQGVASFGRTCRDVPVERGACKAMRGVRLRLSLGRSRNLAAIHLSAVLAYHVMMFPRLCSTPSASYQCVVIGNFEGELSEKSTVWSKCSPGSKRSKGSLSCM